VTKLKEGEGGHRWPQFLPDGQTVLYTAVGAGGSYDDAHIVTYRPDTGEQRVLIRGGTYARYVPTGHLVYYRAGTIMAVPFDPSGLEVRGTPSPVAEGVMPTAGNTGAGQFSFSSLGSLVYIPGGSQSDTATLVWVDRKGVEQPIAAPPRSYFRPRLSPDGRRLATEVVGGPTDLWIYDFSRETLTRLTFEGNNLRPTWTPDGKRIVFDSTRGTTAGIYWKPADNSGPEELLTASDSGNAQSLTPDGKVLAFHTNPNTQRDIWVLPMEGEHKPSVFLQTPFNESAPMFSPDGRWMAYVSDESGRSEIYVRPFPGPGGKWQISTDGAGGAVWNPNGRELFFRSGDRMMAVDVTTQPTFAAGKPRLLFEARQYAPNPLGGQRPNYDVLPDGQRFLMIKQTEQQETALTQIHVVLNWLEELNRRGPTTKQ